MRITSKDVVATLLVASIVVPDIGYLIADELPILLALFIVAVVVTWALGELAAHEGRRTPVGDARQAAPP